MQNNPIGHVFTHGHLPGVITGRANESESWPRAVTPTRIFPDTKVVSAADISCVGGTLQQVEMRASCLLIKGIYLFV